MQLRFSKVGKVKSPSKAYDTDAGIDFFIPEDFDALELYPGEDVNIQSGIRVVVPPSYALVFFNKSGICTNEQLIVGACVVDEGYQGEVHLHLINVGSLPVYIKPNQKIVQGLLVSVPTVKMEEVSNDDLFSSLTSRGEGGFGSTNLEEELNL